MGKYKGKPLVSAIVTNYNGWSLNLLEDFLESFLYKNDFKNFEIFLVDMASGDASVEKAREKFGKDERLKIVQNQVNNMSLGINMALKKAKGKYILFLNNDIYFAKGAIKKLVEFLKENEKVAQVQGKIISYFDHKKIDSAGETMDIFGNPVTIGAEENDVGQYDMAREVLSVGGASGLAKKELLDKFGFLDPDYGIGYEDMDLALKLRIAGYKMYYLPSALVFHKRASSTSKANEKLRAKIKFWFNKNRLATMVKNYEITTLAKSLPTLVMIYVVTGLFEIFYKRLWRFGLSRFKALLWLFFALPLLLSKRKSIQRARKLPDKVAILPFMAKGRLLTGFKGFLNSKSW